MKTKEFEKAIDLLGLAIVIDEMKLSHGHVRQATGHLENEGIIWNEKGEGFSTEFEWRENKEDGDLVGVFGSSLERNKLYDLKFE
ncbi:4-hydroxybenzoyl-CoA thioesterase [Prevotella melaninogenica]|uniref:4-hydroxybenzoyl-CoA thioesterase n=1 Tax=Prevotella melaninogenica TaxID=28132 RepID=UPI001BAD6B36|nr:4-hydroxybenzoyl-CoA thioesterase [Prevotella melaninogenica]QUB63431.1 4-hydroxybenzoyl-CoA thioesterase [Prevotella melaninogenica]